MTDSSSTAGPRLIGAGPVGDPAPDQLRDELADLVDAVVLPSPGEGATRIRHRELFDLGRRDLAIGRLMEAHSDALAILHQAGRGPRRRSLYGVWASGRPGTGITVAPDGNGHLRLDGTMQFCTGIGLCDIALITATDVREPSHGLLVEVDLREMERVGTFSGSTEPWKSSAFASTNTGTVQFAGGRLDDDVFVGPPGWYLGRPGFWHGAIGPAAVWAGGASGLIADAFERTHPSPHVDAHLGALRSIDWELRTILDTSADEIDGDPDDRTGTARPRALIVRHLVERAATEVIDRYGRALGPAPLALDDSIARRVSELALFIRMCHAEADLEILAHDGTP